MVLARVLKERGTTLITQARLNDTHDNVNVMLPGFSIFDVSERIRATEWCTPRQVVDRDEIISVYEEYVDRPLGTTPVPDRVGRSLYIGKASDQFFGRRRKATEWFLPVLKIIALAAHASRGKVTLGPDSVHLDMGDYVMSASPRGCWSNTTGALHRSVQRPDDANTDTLRVPVLLTSHRLAKALVALESPPWMLWIANTAIRAEMAGDIPKIRAVHLDRIPQGRTAQEPFKAGEPADIAAAMVVCRQITDAPYPGSHQDLFASAVPLLMREVDFKDLVGAVGSDPDKVVSEDGCEKFMEYLDIIERQAACSA